MALFKAVDSDTWYLISKWEEAGETPQWLYYETPGAGEVMGGGRTQRMPIAEAESLGAVFYRFNPETKKWEELPRLSLEWEKYDLQADILHDYQAGIRERVEKEFYETWMKDK